MYLIYNILLIVFLVIISPYLIFKLITDKRFRAGLNERWRGPTDCSAKQPIWIHAASVGEVKVASLIIKEIRERWNEQDIVLSVFTDTGMSTAKNILEDVAVFYLPFDLPWIIRNGLDVINPGMFIIVESELWPNLLNAMNKRAVPCILINGRVSYRSYKSYKRVRFFVKRMLRNITQFSMRTEKDSVRIINLGADASRVHITGNLKYEDVFKNAMCCDSDNEKERLFIHENVKVIIFGCTRDGEEEDLMGVFAHLILQRKDVVVIVAPRHINRVEEIEKLFAKHNIGYIRESGITNAEYVKERRIVIVDSLGHLFSLYSISHITFIGGSLRPFGGHNVLEPAVFEKPVLFGAFMSNFEDEANELIRAGGGIRINSPSHLTHTIDELLNDNKKRFKIGKCAKEAIEKNRGAAAATIEIIERFL